MILKVFPGIGGRQKVSLGIKTSKVTFSNRTDICNLYECMKIHEQESFFAFLCSSRGTYQAILVKEESIP